MRSRVARWCEVEILHLKPLLTYIPRCQGNWESYFIRTWSTCFWPVYGHDSLKLFSKIYWSFEKIFVFDHRKSNFSEIQYLCVIYIFISLNKSRLHMFHLPIKTHSTDKLKPYGILLIQIKFRSVLYILILFCRINQITDIAWKKNSYFIFYAL